MSAAIVARKRRCGPRTSQGRDRSAAPRPPAPAPEKFRAASAPERRRASSALPASLHNAWICRAVVGCLRRAATPRFRRISTRPGRRYTAFQAHKSAVFRPKPYKNRTETVHFRTNSVHPARAGFCLQREEKTAHRLVDSGRSRAGITLRGRRATVPKSVRFRAKINQMSSKSRQKHPKSPRKNTHRCAYIRVDTPYIRVKNLIGVQIYE